MAACDKRVTLQGSDLSFRIANLDVSFVGKFDAEGALGGIWKQYGAIVSIKLIHVSEDAAWPVPASEGRPMPSTTDPAFDITTIKPADPKDTGSGFQLRGERLHVRNESLEDIVTFAYGSIVARSRELQVGSHRNAGRSMAWPTPLARQT